jgi:hypothetical protein
MHPSGIAYAIATVIAQFIAIAIAIDNAGAIAHAIANADDRKGKQRKHFLDTQRTLGKSIKIL